MSILYATILGLLFGFILQKTGAANPQKVIEMLRLRDFHLMKTILFSIGFSSLALFLLLSTSIIDSGHISIKSSYIGVIVGGAIFGIGWAISGFCPGTGVVAAGAGRKDALSFIVGGLLGAFIYMLAYASLKPSFLFDKLGDKITLVATSNEKFPILLPDLPAIAVAGSIAIIFILIAWKLPQNQKA